MYNALTAIHSMLVALSGELYFCRKQEESGRAWETSACLLVEDEVKNFCPGCKFSYYIAEAVDALEEF